MQRSIIIKRIISAALAITLVLPVALTETDSIHTSAVPNDASYYQKLEELDKQAEEIDKQLQEAQKDADSAQAQKNAVDEKIAVVQKKIAAINEYSTKLSKDIADTDRKMRRAKKNAEDKKAEIEAGVKDFKERLRAMYVGGASSYTEVLFSSESFYDLLMRTELISRVAKHDSDVIDELTSLKDEYEKNQKELEDEASLLQSKAKEYKEQLDDLNDQNTELLKLAKESSMTLDELNRLKAELLQKGYDIGVQKEELKTTTSAKTETKTTTTSKVNPSTPKSTTTKPAPSQNNTSVKNTQTEPATTKRPTQSTSTTTQPSNNESSGTDSNIATVIATARSMVGGAYVWGAASQNAADCSGLTMYCYGKIGVSLPHNAAAQSGYGRAVNKSDLRPGDLIFFGSPAYHVALYVGDGMMIHAENSYTGIVYSYVDTFAMYNPISAIRRIL